MPGPVIKPLTQAQIQSTDPSIPYVKVAPGVWEAKDDYAKNQAALVQKRAQEAPIRIRHEYEQEAPKGGGMTAESRYQMNDDDKLKMLQQLLNILHSASTGGASVPVGASMTL